MQQPTNPAPADQELDGLFRCYADVVYRIAFQVLGEQTAAEDVVDEVFLRLASAARRPERPGRNYFIKAARNEAFHILKRSEAWRNFVGAVRRMARDKEPGPEVDVELADEREILHGFIKQLPPRCREVMGLVVYGELTQREVAERLGISSGAVEKQVARGHRLLFRMAAKLGLAPAAELSKKVDRGGEGLSGLVIAKARQRRRTQPLVG